MNRCAAAAALVTTAVALAGCTASAPAPRRVAGRVVLSARPRVALLDSDVAVSVTGLPPRARVTLSASARDDEGMTWSSSAQLQASAAGTISLTQPSVGGSYTGRDAMGLFDLMTPDEAGAGAAEFIANPAGYDVNLRVTVAGRTVARGTVHRVSPDADIVRKQLRPADGGVYGELDLPRHPTGRKPAILVLGGSEGGVPTFNGRMLAARGYPALALAYFDEPGLPQTLSRIPLEYFAKALRVLRAQPDVDPRHVLVFGISRGSEAALLLGVHYPTLVNGVVAGVPSSVANPGFPSGGPAWTLAGKPIPTVPAGEEGEPEPPDPAATIPVERIQGPIFTVCAEQDRVWPSCGYAAAITARLTAHHFRYQHVALSYADAGHYVGGISCCYSATPADFAKTGGDAEHTQAGQRDAWRRLLAFLAQQ